MSGAPLGPAAVPLRGLGRRLATAVRWRSRRLLYELRYRFAVHVRRYRVLTLEPDLLRSVFHVCARERHGERTVRKFPRLDNWWARRFFDEIRRPGGAGRFRALLQSLADDPAIGPHVARVDYVDRFGGYESEFVVGENLASLRKRIHADLPPPPGVSFPSVLGALRELRADLRRYWAGGGAEIGDWALHNLIFETSTARIKNVDLEGFLTYQNGWLAASPVFVEHELRGLEQVLELAASSGDDDRRILAALSAVWKSTDSGSPYSGAQYSSGYHSLTIGGRSFRGQRDCRARLAAVPYDFAGKVVLDVGCNCGGMLHALAGEIREGIGIDSDARCVNAANLVAEVNGTKNLRFHTFDPKRDAFSYLRLLTLGRRIDVCLLLSVASWMENWRGVVGSLSSMADVLLFESNGSPFERHEQVEHLHRCFGDVRLLQERSIDDPGEKNRALYLCRGPLRRDPGC